MTPSNHPISPSADETRELLQFIADDTRRQLCSWINPSTLLRCPLIFPPKPWRSTLILVNEGITVLRSTQVCAKEAIRSFRKQRYDRCSRAMDRLDRLRRVYDSIDCKVTRRMIQSLTEEE
jgi:hypothetical protein